MTSQNAKVLINILHSLSSCMFDAAEALKRATPDDDSFDLDSHDTDRPIPFRISDEADALPPAGRVYASEVVTRSGLPTGRGWSALAWLCAAGEVEVTGGWVRWAVNVGR